MRADRVRASVYDFRRTSRYGTIARIIASANEDSRLDSLEKSEAAILLTWSMTRPPARCRFIHCHATAGHQVARDCQLISIRSLARPGSRHLSPS